MLTRSARSGGSSDSHACSTSSMINAFALLARPERCTCLCQQQTAKIGSLVDVQDSEDPEGLRVFYYLVQDLKVSSSGPPRLLVVIGVCIRLATRREAMRCDGGEQLALHSFSFPLPVSSTTHENLSEPTLSQLRLSKLHAQCLIFSLINLHFKIKPI